MKRILFIILAFVLILSGCSEYSTVSSVSEEEVVVIKPDKQTAASVNGYYQPPTQDGTKYYANFNTKKFHIESCRWISKTDSANIIISYERSKLLNEGYTPCKVCKP